MGSRTREAGSARTIEATLTEGRCACCAWADGGHSRGPAAMIVPAATVTTEAVSLAVWVAFDQPPPGHAGGHARHAHDQGYLYG